MSDCGVRRLDGGKCKGGTTYVEIACVHEHVERLQLCEECADPASWAGSPLTCDDCWDAGHMCIGHVYPVGAPVLGIGAAT